MLFRNHPQSIIARSPRRSNPACGRGWSFLGVIPFFSSSFPRRRESRRDLPVPGKKGFAGVGYALPIVSRVTKTRHVERSETSGLYGHRSQILREDAQEDDLWWRISPLSPGKFFDFSVQFLHAKARGTDDMFLIRQDQPGNRFHAPVLFGTVFTRF